MQKIYYERNLPHWQPPGATFFLTYRLAGSIPQSILQQIQVECIEQTQAARRLLTGQALDDATYAIQRRFFKRYDDSLDHNPNGPYWLRRPGIAREVMASLQYCGKQFVDLHAFCIMPNHVHVLLGHRLGAPVLSDVLQRHKGFTGKSGNRLLGRTGQFWNRETYDHVVRGPKEFDRIVRYILNNPVKAKLVVRWEDWPYTFVRAL